MSTKAPPSRSSKNSNADLTGDLTPQRRTDVSFTKKNAKSTKQAANLILSREFNHIASNEKERQARSTTQGMQNSFGNILNNRGEVKVLEMINTHSANMEKDDINKEHAYDP